MVSDLHEPAESWDDTATLWFLVRQVAARMDRSGEALYRDGLGISLAQFLVLSVVDAYPGRMNQQAVAERLGLTKGTVSRQIESAVAADLMTVTVAPHSRRENVVELTPKGTALVRRGDALIEAVVRDDFPAIPSADLAATLRTLAALNETLAGRTGSDT